MSTYPGRRPLTPTPETFLGVPGVAPCITGNDERAAAAELRARQHLREHEPDTVSDWPILGLRGEFMSANPGIDSTYLVGGICTGVVYLSIV